MTENQKVQAQKKKGVLDNFLLKENRNVKIFSFQIQNPLKLGMNLLEITIHNRNLNSLNRVKLQHLKFQMC